MHIYTQIAKFMGPTWGPPGPCRPQMGPMLAPWTLLSGQLWLLDSGDGTSCHICSKFKRYSRTLPSIIRYCYDTCIGAIYFIMAEVLVSGESWLWQQGSGVWINSRTICSHYISIFHSSLQQTRLFIMYPVHRNRGTKCPEIICAIQLDV